MRKVNCAIPLSTLKFYLFIAEEEALLSRLRTPTRMQYLPNNTTRSASIRDSLLPYPYPKMHTCSMLEIHLRSRRARASPPPSLTVNAPLATRKSEPHARLHEHGARHTAQPSGAHNAAAAVTQRSGQRGRLARAGLALLSTRSRRDLVVVSQPPRSRAPPRAGLAR